jgi:hypothetical protein
LAEYDYEIVHKRGFQNTNADALSRIGIVGKVKSGRTSLMRIRESKFCMSSMIPP